MSSDVILKAVCVNQNPACDTFLSLGFTVLQLMFKETYYFFLFFQGIYPLLSYFVSLLPPLSEGSWFTELLDYRRALNGFAHSCCPSLNFFYPLSTLGGAEQGLCIVFRISDFSAKLSDLTSVFLYFVL